MKDIIFAEDDTNIREWVSIALEASGYTIRPCEDGDKALKAYSESRPDILIVDVMMPKVSGWDVVTEIRKHDKHVPILMLTARSSEADKVIGFELGADDYLAKPFGLGELRARVAALLRRAGLGSDPHQVSENFKIGSVVIDVANSSVITEDDSIVSLTRLELGILKVLQANRGELVSREKILNSLWGADYSGTERTIDTRVVRLRQKMGASGSFIETVYATGYKLAK